jgi:hypothetical protein
VKSVEILDAHVTGLESGVAEILPGDEIGGGLVGNHTAALESVEHTDRLAHLNQRTRQVVVGSDQVSEDAGLAAKVENLVTIPREVDVGPPAKSLVGAFENVSF